jgi:hypothetical protein
MNERNILFVYLVTNSYVLPHLLLLKKINDKVYLYIK